MKSSQTFEMTNVILSNDDHILIFDAYDAERVTIKTLNSIKVCDLKWQNRLFSGEHTDNASTCK